MEKIYLSSEIVIALRDNPKILKKIFQDLFVEIYKLYKKMTIINT